MMKISGVVVAIILAMTLIGCTADYEDPYESYVSPDLDWPTLDPNRYHWDGISNPYYEGWYYRVTEPLTGRSYFFIYGVQNPGTRGETRSGGFVYVQRDDGQRAFLITDLNDFWASKAECNILVGNAKATEDRITGTIATDNGKISWDLSLSGDVEWTDTMGILTNIPGIAVNWHVDSLIGQATGTVHWEEETTIFESAPAYQDHNWGDVFPSSWLWLQALRFTDPNEGLALAGGPIALGPLVSSAMMIIYYADGKRYEYRTQDINTLFQVDVDADLARVNVTATKGIDRLIIRADARPETFYPVYVPTYDGMVNGALESFHGFVIVDVMKKQDGAWRLIKRSASATATVELGGAYGGFDF